MVRYAQKVGSQNHSCSLSDSKPGLLGKGIDHALIDVKIKESRAICFVMSEAGSMMMGLLATMAQYAAQIFTVWSTGHLDGLSLQTLYAQCPALWLWSVAILVLRVGFTNERSAIEAIQEIRHQGI
jgi:hypothetical protein